MPPSFPDRPVSTISRSPGLSNRKTAAVLRQSLSCSGQHTSPLDSPALESSSYGWTYSGVYQVLLQRWMPYRASQTLTYHSDQCIERSSLD